MTLDSAVSENVSDGGIRNASENTQQFLTFTLGTEEYGVDIMMVREVKGWTDTTRLPNTPEYVRGVLNLRGIIIPIFDLRARFTGRLTDPDKTHVVVILAVENRTVGILVDAVSDILSVGEDDKKPAPETESQVDQRFIAGLIAVENRMVVLLDIGRLVHSDIAKISENSQKSAA